MKILKLIMNIGLCIMAFILTTVYHDYILSIGCLILAGIFRIEDKL